MTSEFVRFYQEKAAVMNAPYWRASLIGGATDAEHVKLVRARLAEKELLLDVIEGCRSYDDLQGEARAIYDRAKATLRGGQGGRDEQPIA